MSEQAVRAIMSAAASSAMEGLPLDDHMLEIVKKIFNGEMQLQDYFDSIKSKHGVS